MRDHANAKTEAWDALAPLVPAVPLPTVKRLAQLRQRKVLGDRFEALRDEVSRPTARKRRRLANGNDDGHTYMYPPEGGTPVNSNGNPPSGRSARRRRAGQSAP